MTGDLYKLYLRALKDNQKITVVPQCTFYYIICIGRPGYRYGEYILLTENKNI